MLRMPGVATGWMPSDGKIVVWKAAQQREALGTAIAGPPTGLSPLVFAPFWVLLLGVGVFARRRDDREGESPRAGAASVE